MKNRVDLIIKNAGEPVTVSGASKKPKTGKELQELGILKSGAVAIEDGIIKDVDTCLLEGTTTIEIKRGFAPSLAPFYLLATDRLGQ